jgi:hypothetical protein
MDGVITFEVPAFDPPPPPPPPVLSGEVRTFDRLLPELLKAHRGEYVAILGDRVVGTGPDRHELLTRVYADHGYQPILCRLVTDQPPRVVHIPSVRVGRAG